MPNKEDGTVWLNIAHNVSGFRAILLNKKRKSKISQVAWHLQTGIRFFRKITNLWILFSLKKLILPFLKGEKKGNRNKMKKEEKERMKRKRNKNKKKIRNKMKKIWNSKDLI